MQAVRYQRRAGPGKGRAGASAALLVAASSMTGVLARACDGDCSNGCGAAHQLSDR
ncbi:hypothetical protein ACSS6W_009626 [Trichoderma asperelloides]